MKCMLVIFVAFVVVSAEPPRYRQFQFQRQEAAPEAAPEGYKYDRPTSEFRLPARLTNPATYGPPDTGYGVPDNSYGLPEPSSQLLLPARQSLPATYGPPEPSYGPPLEPSTTEQPTSQQPTTTETITTTEQPETVTDQPTQVIDTRIASASATANLVDGRRYKATNARKSEKLVNGKEEEAEEVDVDGDGSGNVNVNQQDQPQPQQGIYYVLLPTGQLQKVQYLNAAQLGTAAYSTQYQYQTFGNQLQEPVYYFGTKLVEVA